MVNITDRYWEVYDGSAWVSLHTWAQSLDTLDGVDAPPPLRGSDFVVPYSPGERFIPKVPGSRVITLSGWIKGTNADGLSSNQRDTFEENWRNLRRLLWRPAEQFRLRKRFKVNGTMRTAEALVQYNGGLAPTRIGRTAAKFMVDLKLTDPFFYTPVVQAPLVNGANSLNVLGDAVTHKIKATISGARSNPQIANTSFGGRYFRFNGSLLSGETLTIDVQQFTARKGTQRYNTSIVHDAQYAEWFALKPGTNSVSLSSASGTGAVVLEYQEAWF